MWVSLLATGWAAEPESPIVKSIDALASSAIAAKKIVGIGIGVMKKGEIILAAGYGDADVENKIKATEHTIFRIGSITKQFTAAGILLLAERGKLSLDDEITKYFPDFPVNGQHITLERLLSHTAGLKRNFENYMASNPNDTHEQFVALFGHDPLRFPPGEMFKYSNRDYYILGTILEKVSGQSYLDFVQQNIFKPAGLNETYNMADPSISKPRAFGYRIQDGQFTKDEDPDMKPMFSTGAIGSTVTDLLKWQTALVHNKVLSQESWRRMTKPVTLNNGSAAEYGLGLFVSQLDGHPRIHHGGYVTGFRAELSYFPDDDVTVAILCNAGPVRQDEWADQVARIVFAGR